MNCLVDQIAIIDLNEALLFEYFPPLSDKVEKILKGSLDSIPSPSPLVKIQTMGGKVCLCKGKRLLGVVNKFFVLKVC